MKTIALLAQKGGTGKTTMALHLAVEAGRTSRQPVVVIDLDPQKSAARWYAKRESDNPILIDPGNRNLADVLDICRDDGVGLVLIDTAPHALADASAAASVADLVVISGA